MDPNAALGLLREWAATAIEERTVRMELDAAQAFTDLDRSLTSGGFLPKEWAEWDDYRSLRKS